MEEAGPGPGKQHKMTRSSASLVFIGLTHNLPVS